jgi:hypothetical protein
MLQIAAFLDSVPPKFAGAATDSPPAFQTACVKQGSHDALQRGIYMFKTRVEYKINRTRMRGRISHGMEPPISTNLQDLPQKLGCYSHMVSESAWILCLAAHHFI